MKKIKITESQYNNLLKNKLNEAGGYDDMGIMALHGQATTGLLQTVIRHITEMLDKTEEAFQQNMGKEDIMAGVSLMTNVLSKIKEELKKIAPELVNDDLKLSAQDLFITVKDSEKKLRILSNQTHSSAHPNMPPAMTGMGFSMDPEDVNDFLFNILMDLGKQSEKLAFQVRDELQTMTRRLSDN